MVNIHINVYLFKVINCLFVSNHQMQKKWNEIEIQIQKCNVANEIEEIHKSRINCWVDVFLLIDTHQNRKIRRGKK